MLKNEIKLGQKVKDRVTGFTGIVISKLEYLNGCIQLGVKPNKLKDGETLEAEYVDIEQMDVVGNGINKPEKKQKEATGGPQRDVPKKGYGLSKL